MVCLKFLLKLESHQRRNRQFRGDNQWGQLGDGTTERRYTPVAMDISGKINGDIFDISCSQFNTYILVHPESCPGRYNPKEECLECIGNYDTASDCTTCRNNWNISTNCTACNLGWRIGSDEECTQPICTEECVGGRVCTAPDTCTCGDNYEDNGSGICVCVNHYDNSTNCTQCFGNWDEQDQCTSCKSGWLVGSDFECSEYFCNDCGVGGTCVGPQTCNCEVNFMKDDNGGCSSCVGNYDLAVNCTTCVSGYSAGDCSQPICSNGCGSGNCSAPGVCTCNGNYITDPNGACTLCKNHYDINSLCTICSGHWSITSDCTACESGWQTGIDNECSAPTCSGGCGGGICTAPQTCTCNQNYVQDESGRCTRCTDNFDILTSCSTCLSGWTNDSCSQPICEMDCMAGTCTSPNICTCSKNYVKDLNERCSKCKTNYDILSQCTKCTAGYTGSECTELVAASKLPSTTITSLSPSSEEGEVSIAALDNTTNFTFTMIVTVFVLVTIFV
jgi:hypothetical protein